MRRPGPRIAGKLPAMAVVVRVGWRLVLLVVATAEEEEGEEGCLLGLVQRGIGRRKFQMLPFLWGGGGFSRWHDRRRTLEVEASRAPRAVSEGHRRAEGGGFVQQGNEESLAVVAFGFAHDALQLGTVGGVILGVRATFLFQHSSTVRASVT